MIDIGPNLVTLLRDAFWAVVCIVVVLAFLGVFDKD